ncbi:MAG: CinA family protein [Proteobacteria bacterium]|nr:CinA family protein [Pseudomonadota bacterium]
MNTNILHGLVKEVLEQYREAHLRIATAESCTGGMIAAALTAVAGSSDVFERGFVTYSNEAKAELLGIPIALIIAHGAVSEPVARAMAEGALAHSAAEVAVSVTGVAGPGGGSPAKPVGLVFIGAAGGGDATVVERHIFTGDRDSVRLASARAALDLLSRRVG